MRIKILLGLLLLSLFSQISFGASFDNPYSSYGEYLKDINNEQGIKEINTYVEDVSSFIKGKCGNCENIILVGSDYVVPGHRSYFTYGKNNIFSFGSVEKDYILSDSIYANNNYADLSFVNFEDYLKVKLPSGTYDTKNVIFALPQNWTKDSPEYLNLKTSLDYLNLNQHIFYTSSVKEYEDVSCESFATLNGATLFIIGTPETNRLFNCYNNDNYDVDSGLMAIDRNIWSSNDVVFLVSSSTLSNFSSIVLNRDYQRMSGGYYEALYWTNNVKIFFNIIPGVGPVINFLVADPLEEIIKLGDSCSYVIDSPNIGNSVSCLVGVTLQVGTVGKAEKSGAGKLTRKIVDDVFDPALSKTEQTIFRDIISQSSKFAHIQTLKNSDDIAKYLAKDDTIYPLEHWTEKSLDDFDRLISILGKNVLDEGSEKQVVAVLDSPFTKIKIGDEVIEKAVVLERGNSKYGSFHLIQKHILGDEFYDSTTGEVNTVFLKIINGKEVRMETDEVFGLISRALKEEPMGAVKSRSLYIMEIDIPNSKYKEIKVFVGEDGTLITAFPSGVK